MAPNTHWTFTPIKTFPIAVSYYYNLYFTHKEIKAWREDTVLEVSQLARVDLGSEPGGLYV